MMLIKVMAGVATMAAVTSSSLMFVQNLPLTRQVAQIIFDRTHIAMPKMTIAPCDNSKHALLQADFDIQVRDPYPMWAGMKANLSPMKTELSFEDESGRTKIGEFEMPELSNHHGHNAVSSVFIGERFAFLPAHIGYGSRTWMSESACSNACLLLSHGAIVILGMAMWVLSNMICATCLVRGRFCTNIRLELMTAAIVATPAMTLTSIIIVPNTTVDT